MTLTLTASADEMISVWLKAFENAGRLGRSMDFAEIETAHIFILFSISFILYLTDFFSSTSFFYFHAKTYPFTSKKNMSHFILSFRYRPFSHPESPGLEKLQTLTRAFNTGL